eukprot:scaffold421_cov382-Prasinococcus_capsulatus_cf.AAC.1
MDDPPQPAAMRTARRGPCAIRWVRVAAASINQPRCAGQGLAAPRRERDRARPRPPRMRTDSPPSRATAGVLLLPARLQLARRLVTRWWASCKAD